MDARSSLGLFGISGVALLLGALAACAAPATEETQGTSSSVTERPFDRHEALDDASMRDSAAMSIADVQKFLDKTPWGSRSVLAQYKEDGKSAAAIMVEAAKRQGINPLEMIVRVQMEQGLISKTTAPASTMAIAFGCGCPHSPLCSDKYRGFANQAECAAGTMRRSMDRATTSTGTASGWKRGSSKTTEDGVAIVPRNAVTAALYTYTPWVGEAGGGRKGVGGVSLHAQVWDRFAEAVSYGVWATQSEGEVEQQADAGTRADAAPQPAPAPEPAPAPAPAPAEEPAPSEPEADPAPAPAADAGTGTGTGSAEPPVEDDTESQGAPSDGSEDGEILSQGSTPPSSNAPPPKTSSRSPSSGSSPSGEDDATPTSTANKGCSTSGHGGSTSAPLAACAMALALLGARRRRASR